jgi:MerR family transcriptional regulator/heat shock protein HspR
MDDDRTPNERSLSDRAVYVISVAAELAGVHPQTLRMYERRGLLRPSRTAGNSRRYSAADIARLRAIQRLTQELGINLAGVQMIMDMEEEVEELRRRSENLADELDSVRQRLALELARLARERPAMAIVPRRPLMMSAGDAPGQDGEP